jgi:hypothetical protein
VVEVDADGEQHDEDGGGGDHHEGGGDPASTAMTRGCPSATAKPM